tara:strand:- start:1939 stop:2238 length:300 start_codon:yes stop_codon:yes gene_type:complete
MPEVSYTPKVSLDPKVHYKTQGSKYDQLLIEGPLTDSSIHKYALAGRYGHSRQQNARAVQLKRDRARMGKAARKRANEKDVHERAADLTATLLGGLLDD